MLHHRQPTIAAVLRSKPLALAPLPQAFPDACGVVLVAGVLAQALEVLRAKDGDVLEQLALALTAVFRASTTHLLGFNVVEVVLLESVAAKALTGRADGLAIDALNAPPVHVEPVLALFLDVLLELFELLLAHELAPVGSPHDVLVFWSEQWHLPI